MSFTNQNFQTILYQHPNGRTTGDNFGMLSCGKFSVFMWDNDTKNNYIAYPIDLQIILMPVNKDDNELIFFNEIHSAHYPYNELLMPDGICPPTHPINDIGISTTNQDTNSDQKSNKVLSQGSVDCLLPIGTIACYSKKKRH